jgi:GH15 family glucan-1,4-alpha-glucosidase
MNSNGYSPIESYGALGDLRTVALVGRDGSIDWCCLPHLDSPSVFGALLDVRRGGRFRVRCVDAGVGSQRYERHTNVLETTFDGPRGRLVLTDFMPLRGTLDGCGASEADHAIYRVLRAEGGPVEVEVEWVPRFDYGRQAPEIVATYDGHVARSGDLSLTLGGLGNEARIQGDEFGALVRARITLQPGETRVLATAWGAQPPEVSREAAARKLSETVTAWRSWVHKKEATADRGWAGEHSELVIRSELALKLLTHADTGAIAAAATTSLPEVIGGTRNWDYRFTWIRDAALSAQALFALGHAADAEAFIRWAERSAQHEEERGWGLRILFTLGGEREHDENVLSHLEGYQRSAPVRVGNGASSQRQLDIYGELISAAYELVRLGRELEAPLRGFVPHVADQACAVYDQPDHGIWEVREGPHHFVYSKAMVWMALDRAVRLHERGAIQGDVERWRSALADIRDEVLDRGFDTQLGAFKQSYERSVLDASNLLLPLLEIVSFDDPRVRSNLDRTLQELAEGALVRRYRASDGLPGEEGAFVLCSFWLVDALALAGRVDEARRIYEDLVARASPLGLYAEQIDPRTGAFLGNFPQAFSHVGLINSTLYLAYAEGRPTPVRAPIGSPEHRNSRS